MASISDIMVGLENRLKTIPGLRASDYVPDQINPPVAVVGVPPIENYHQTMKRGTTVYVFAVTVIVSASLDRAGQRLLAEYVDPFGEKSIRKAIESERSLGGIVNDAVVDSFRPLGLEEVGAIPYYGGVFTVRVVVPGE